MPTYEYECTSCGLRFERRQSITAEPLTDCPECHGKVRRLIAGGTGFILKGAGASRPGGQAAGCSLEREGRTCCGREERCSKPPCGSDP